jgi:hypothetical protein
VVDVHAVWLARVCDGGGGARQALEGRVFFWFICFSL